MPIKQFERLAKCSKNFSRLSHNLARLRLHPMQLKHPLCDIHSLMTAPNNPAAVT
jgi:hypothetical protein